MVHLAGAVGRPRTGTRAARRKTAGSRLSADRTGELVRQLLTCVYQVDAQQRRRHANAARTVAEAVGAEFLEWNVDAMVDDYVATVSQAVGRELDLGARRRRAAEHSGPGPRAGDLAAGESARRAAAHDQQPQRGGRRLRHDGRRHLRRARADRRHRQGVPARLAQVDGNDRARRASGRSPALAVVNDQRPTAELRPPAADQTDEGDLMPYRVLDAIERAAIRDKLMPVEVWETSRRSSRSTTRSNWPPGSSGSSGSGAATSGSASATPRRSTSTTRTSTPRPGAASRFSPAASSGNSDASCVSASHS